MKTLIMNHNLSYVPTVYTCIFIDILVLNVFSFIINTMILIPDYYCFYNKYTFKSFLMFALFYNHMKNSYLDSVIFCIFSMLAASLFILLWFLFLLFSWLTCIYIFFRKEMCMLIVLSSHTSGLFFIIPLWEFKYRWL